MNARATSSARSSGQLATSAAMPSLAGSRPVAAGLDDRPAQPLDVVEQVLATGFAQHLAEQAAEQPDVARICPGSSRRSVSRAATTGMAVPVPAPPVIVVPLPPPSASWLTCPSQVHDGVRQISGPLRGAGRGRG